MIENLIGRGLLEKPKKSSEPALKKILIYSYLRQTFHSRTVGSMRLGVNFINMFMGSFYTRRSWKHKKLLGLTVFLHFWDLLVLKLHVKFGEIDPWYFRNSVFSPPYPEWMGYGVKHASELLSQVPTFVWRSVTLQICKKGKRTRNLFVR